MKYYLFIRIISIRWHASIRATLHCIWRKCQHFCITLHPFFSSARGEEHFLKSKFAKQWQRFNDQVWIHKCLVFVWMCASNVTITKWKKNNSTKSLCVSNFLSCLKCLANFRDVEYFKWTLLIYLHCKVLHGASKKRQLHAKDKKTPKRAISIRCDDICVKLIVKRILTWHYRKVFRWQCDMRSW